MTNETKEDMICKCEGNNKRKEKKDIIDKGAVA